MQFSKLFMTLVALALGVAAVPLTPEGKPLHTLDQGFVLTFSADSDVDSSACKRDADTWYQTGC